jgi:mono/diheme cytochrome c family protein
MMIHISRDGQQFGPYTVAEVNSYLAECTLLPTDLAWFEGAPEWMPITQVPGVEGGAAPVVTPKGKRKPAIILGAVAAVVMIAAGVAFGFGLFSSDGKNSGASANGDKPGPKSGDQVFAKTAGPVFERNRCFECHHTGQSGKAKADLDFANPKSLKGFVLPNQPGNPATAPIVLVLTPGAVEPMPPKGPAVNAADVEIIKAWIAAGAKF